MIRGGAVNWEIEKSACPAHFGTVFHLLGTVFHLSKQQVIWQKRTATFGCRCQRSGKPGQYCVNAQLNNVLLKGSPAIMARLVEVV